MASAKVVLRQDQPKKDGTYPILIRLIQDRKIKYVSTGYSVKPAQFRDEQDNWVYKHPDAALMNRAIEMKRAPLAQQFIQAQIDGSNFSIDKKKVTTVFKAVTAMLTAYEQQEKVGAFNRLQTNLRYLKEAWSSDVELNALTKDHINKYIAYRKKKGNGDSTIKKNLQDLATCIKAVEGYNGPNAFLSGYKNVKSRPVDRTSLTFEETRLLEDVKLSGLTDQARDMYLFAYYCQGMRFESVATFQVSMIKNNHIHYRMNKGKKVRDIEIHPKLQAIIDKYKALKSLYHFPVIKRKHDAWTKKEVIGSANVLMNTHLKRAALIAGIDRSISMHIAKHSFASLGLKKGVSYSILKDALGHSTYAMTENYLKSISDDRINEAVRGLFD